MRFVKTAENLFGLPTGFQRVAYLESTGTQYIDTGYKPVPATTKFEFYFSPTNISGNYFLFGARPNTDIGGHTCTTYFSTGNVRQDWAGLSSYFPRINVGDKVLYSAYNNTISLNDNSVTGTVVRSTTRLDYNFLLFTVNTNGTADNRRYVGRVYYAKLWDDGVLVRDYIPALDPLGVPCMYDLVGKKPYYNQGTGEFTVGRQIIPVEYLQSTGTQYIDTMIKSSANMFVKTKFNLSDVSAKAVFGSYSGSASNGVGVFFGTAGGNLSGKVYCNNTNVAVSPDLTLSTNTDYEIEMSGTTLTVNGSDYTSATTADNNYNMILFARNNNGTVERQISGKIYYFTIKDNGTLVADFIPCKDENNVGYMFDALSGIVYENAGTGAFVVGNNKYKMKLRLIKDNILPTGYTQVEYIEAENGGGSTVVQYAVGNYRLTDTTDWEITFSAESPGNNWVLGQPTWIGVHYRKDTTTGNLPRVGITNAAASANQCYVDYTNNEKITLALKGTDVYANGVKVGSITRVSAPAAQTKFGIFAYKDINQELPNLRIQSARIYRLKIWDNGVLAQDLIPAIKDGVAGFYERVNKTFIEKESNSTSDFTTGKPVLPIVRFPVDPVPAGYKTVNYLESTGTQYIDTGVLPSEDLRTKVVQAFTGDSIAKNSSILGSNGNGNLRYWINYDNHFEVGYGNYLSTYTVVQPDEVNIIDFNYIKEDNKHYFNINGTEYTTTGTPNTSYNIVLFGRVVMDSAPVLAPQRIYKVQFIRNNALIGNFIPVIRLLDNKAGMWDTVTKQFYTTPVGDFITG